VTRRTLTISVALLVGVVATDLVLSSRSHQTPFVRGRAGVADCLGPDSIVQITPGRIGALQLDLSLAELRRQCGNLGWTTTNGDESLDTAVLLTRPGLRVVGVVATLVDDGGDRRPIQIDSGAHVALWKVSGTRGVLPDGVPLTATWNALRRVYGPLGAFALNGIVYVTICRRPGISVQMELSNPGAPINPVDGVAQLPATVDSAMGETPIAVVEVASVPSPRSASC
jgi:hypothetical protein